MFTVVLYILILILMSISLIKSRKKTLLALKKAWKSFENILPLFLSILFVIGIMLAILSPRVISKIMGHQSGILGLMLAALIETMIKLMGKGSGLKGMIIAFLLGSFAAGPVYVSFPFAAVLMKKGSKFFNVLIFIGA